MLLVSNKLVAIYKGSTNSIEYVIARTSKFFVYFLFLVVIYMFGHYLKDLFLKDGKLDDIPKAIKLSDYVIITGAVVLTISQFTGLYYYYDSNHVYHRSDGFFISFIFPVVALIIQFITIIKNRSRLSKRMVIPLLLFAIVPLIASIPQFLGYGLLYTSYSIIAMVVLLYCFSIIDTNKLLRKAHEQELDNLRREQKNIKLMISQTVEALAEAIDTKDKYTNGHSRRVAEYSKMIAKRAGKTDAECDEIYIVGLLHDVGKIGIPIKIINKETALTDEEYETIKTHTTAGKKILSKISMSPDLVLGANYHHERYDGTGYPEGKKGDDIPEVARIIAVADAYDAMASKRSYRDALPQKVIREELVKGSGTQFDPTFAKIMIELVDSDTEYQLKEK
jgi:HD superfamily phosphohydrolase YqeK